MNAIILAMAMCQIDDLDKTIQDAVEIAEEAPSFDDSMKKILDDIEKTRVDEKEEASRKLAEAFLDAQKKAGIVPKAATEPMPAKDLTITDFARMEKPLYQSHLRAIKDLELKLKLMEAVRREKKRLSVDYYRRNYLRPQAQTRAQDRKARIAAGIPAMKHTLSRNAGNYAAFSYWQGFEEGVRLRLQRGRRYYPLNSDRYYYGN